MTKVSLKVTRDLTEVSSEVEDQLSSLSSRIAECSKKLQSLSSSVSLDLPMKTVAGQVALQHDELRKVLESVDDLFNICKSYSEIMEESEKQQKQKELDDIVERQVGAFKIDAEAKIGQAIAKENFLVKQIKDLKQQIENLPTQKSTKKSSTRKK